MSENMKVQVLIVVVCGMALLISSSVQGYCEFQITKDENSQGQPDIYEDIVVWESNEWREKDTEKCKKKNLDWMQPFGHVIR